MGTYELRIETDNPDLRDKIKRAFDQVGLDVDNAGNPHDLDAMLVSVDNNGVETYLWGTVYQPDRDTEGVNV